MRRLAALLAAFAVTLALAGPTLAICHIPGHEAYGMVGTLTVT